MFWNTLSSKVFSVCVLATLLVCVLLGPWPPVGSVTMLVPLHTSFCTWRQKPWVLDCKFLSRWLSGDEQLNIPLHLSFSAFCVTVSLQVLSHNCVSCLVVRGRISDLLLMRGKNLRICNDLLLLKNQLNQSPGYPWMLIPLGSQHVHEGG